MYSHTKIMTAVVLIAAMVASSEGFFLKWGSDTSGQQKAWVQNVSPYRYQYSYAPYDPRKVYQMQSPQYAQAEVGPSMAPIPISVPAGAALTPVSLQHVQLVPCMCPVAPEEADKLHEQAGPGPYLAQAYPQQIAVTADNKNKQ